MTIGFTFARNEFRYCVLQGSFATPEFVEKDKISYPINLDLPEFMNWMQTQLLMIIDKLKPKRASYKISLALDNLEQIKYACYPQAILNLVAHQKELECEVISSGAINMTKFGGKRSEDIMAHVDTILGQHPPYWDKPMKEAALLAWFNLRA